MRIINPGVEFIDDMSESIGIELMKKIEKCGRVCYKSEDKIGTNSYEKFISGIIKRGHESVLEHASVTVKFICDRGVTHEIVRHRIGAYSQESTRYCNYSNEKFGNEITVIKPCFFDENTNPALYDKWFTACRDAEYYYFRLLEFGASPQEARSVLPNSLKTEIVVTYNIREWRHFFKLRCSKAAHPQMREVATMALKEFYKYMPTLFEDIYTEIMKDE